MIKKFYLLPILIMLFASLTGCIQESTPDPGLVFVKTDSNQKFSAVADGDVFWILNGNIVGDGPEYTFEGAQFPSRHLLISVEKNGRDGLNGMKYNLHKHGSSIDESERTIYSQLAQCEHKKLPGRWLVTDYRVWKIFVVDNLYDSSDTDTDPDTDTATDTDTDTDTNTDTDDYSSKVGKKYFIKNVGTGKYLNVDSNSNANNANVSIFTHDGTSGQRFTILSSSYGIMLKPDCNSGVVNVFADKASDGDNVNIRTKTGSETQTWQLYTVPGGYNISSVYDSDFVLNATGSSDRSNVNIQTYAGSEKQIWAFEPVSSKLISHLNKRIGETSEPESCGAFVSKVFDAVYGTGHQGCCCAAMMREKFLDSSSKSDMPIGAAVFYDNKTSTCTECGRNAGHIAIYVGNNEIIHASGGRIFKASIDSVPNYRGWGWFANLSLK